MRGLAVARRRSGRPSSPLLRAQHLERVDRARDAGVGGGLQDRLLDVGVGHLERAQRLDVGGDLRVGAAEAGQEGEDDQLALAGREAPAASARRRRPSRRASSPSARPSAPGTRLRRGDRPARPAAPVRAGAVRPARSSPLLDPVPGTGYCIQSCPTAVCAWTLPDLHTGGSCSGERILLDDGRELRGGRGALPGAGRADQDHRHAPHLSQPHRRVRRPGAGRAVVLHEAALDAERARRRSAPPPRRALPELRGRGGRRHRPRHARRARVRGARLRGRVRARPTTSACTTSATPTAARCCG